MNNYLNIVAIQKDDENILEALKNINPDTKDCLLFNNCLSKMKLVGREIPLYFDKMLYSKENNLLMVVRQESLISYNDIKNILQKKNIAFKEYNCQKEKDDYKYNDNLKEFFFVNSKEKLERVVKDSKEKGFDSCTYYPNVFGNLEISYLDKDKNKECLKKINFDGAVELDDKIILIVNQKRLRSIDDKELYSVIAKIPLRMIIDIDVNINSLEVNNKEKKLKKIV